MKFFAVLLCILSVVLADTYMHNPRGSNDRLNENNENRNNADRLFDSQNNAKGGYCVGPQMTYYEGSMLMVEWTAQHGCGQNKKVYCNVVLQYMCTTNDADVMIRVRDGTTTNTIPDNVNGPKTVANNALTFGMHESYQWYQDCKARSRNKGLFISDRNLNGNTAIYTRQNNNGGRRGYECPEERDYYPYWVASPWKDVAILSNDKEWCDFYKAESQNVKSRFRCQNANGNQAAPITEPECVQAGNTWVEQAAWNIPAPVCMEAKWQRDNHLGSSDEGASAAGGATFNWTMPWSMDESCINTENCACTLRLRYNISTNELANRPDAGFTDWASNKILLQDDLIATQDGAAHQLALDTSQFGRTFQDRSHVFNMKKRPAGVTNINRLFNLNVRGKRGNIVQAYPSVEYDFVPNHLIARAGDLIHFSWTGCDTNPAGNAGEGTAQTDRSNIVQVENFNDNKPAGDTWLSSNIPLFEDSNTRLYFAMQNQQNCLTYEQLKKKNNNNENNIETDVQNCMKLNAATQFFDGGIIRMNLTGNFYYTSTRNNNFSNRAQKGQIDVDPLLPSWAIAIVAIGAGLFVASAGVAGLMVYAKSNPHSGIASALSRI